MSNIIKPDFQKKTPGAKTRSGEQEQIVPNYQLLLEIAFSSPSIWRRIIVPGRTTLAELHKVIDACYGWTGDHGHRFWVGKVFYGPAEVMTNPDKFDEAGVQLHELEHNMGFIFTYLYDAGSGWECEITLEQVLPGSDKPGLPQLVEGGQANPSAGFIDIHEYQSFLWEIDSLPAKDAGKRLSEYDLARDFDPEYCDLESLGRAVRQVV